MKDVTMKDRLIDTRTGQGIVFVVGCPRSGTTWIQRMLATHPSINTGQESFLFNRYISPALGAWRSHLETTEKKRGGLGLPTYVDGARFREMMSDHLAQLLDAMIGDVSPNALFLEKTPDHGLVLADIAQLLPEAKILNVIRSPRAVASSVMKAAGSWGADWAPKEPVGALRFWRRHVEAALHARAELDATQYFEMRYENLRADTVGWLTQALDFIGLASAPEQIAQIVDANSLEKSRKGEGTAIPIKGEIASRTGRGTVVDSASFVGSGPLNAWAPEVPWATRVKGEVYMRYATRKPGLSADLIREYL